MMSGTYWTIEIASFIPNGRYIMPMMSGAYWTIRYGMSRSCNVIDSSGYHTLLGVGNECVFSI